MKHRILVDYWTKMCLKLKYNQNWCFWERWIHDDDDSAADYNYEWRFRCWLASAKSGSRRKPPPRTSTPKIWATREQYSLSMTTIMIVMMLMMMMRKAEKISVDISKTSINYLHLLSWPKSHFLGHIQSFSAIFGFFFQFRSCFKFPLV